MNLDIIGISETSQRENSEFSMNVSIEGYHHPFTIGSKTAKGGVALYAKNNLDIWVRDDLITVNEYYEAIWVEIKSDKAKHIICGCLYRHPNSDSKEFVKYLSTCLAKITKEKEECYLLGDFNVDLLKYDTNNKSSDFLNAVTSFGFLPYILQPTRISDHSTTLIDNIYGNNFEQESVSGNILIMFADHFSQFLSINKEIIKPSTSNVFKRDFSSFEENMCIDDVSIQNWNNNLHDTNSKFDDFLWKMGGCVNRHAPIKKLTRKEIKKMKNPWITNNILKLISHIDRLFHKIKKTLQIIIPKVHYKLFRNRVTREIKKAKREYYKIYFENNLNNMKKTWHGIKKIINMNNNVETNIPQLQYDSKLINTDKGMANAFNDFFTKIGPELDQEIPKTKSNRSYNILKLKSNFLISHMSY